MESSLYHVSKVKSNVPIAPDKRREIGQVSFRKNYKSSKRKGAAMARPERVNSATMTQNVGLKGLNDENVFLDDEDREVFLDAMAKASEKSGVEVSAWALMDNHVHLLMHGEIGDFSPFFSRCRSAMCRILTRGMSARGRFGMVAIMRSRSSRLKNFGR